jgi:mRNA deadenylase 3'-5' endonuclease subunit Ccr4
MVVRLFAVVAHAGALMVARPPLLTSRSRTAGSACTVIERVTEPKGCDPELIPHGQRVSSSANSFSLLSWNCLLPNGEDNWWCEKMYQSHVPEEARRWPHRQQLIQERVLQAGADIVCIQEAAGDTFDSDFAFMHAQGYESVLHRKFRFRCATFYRPAAFTLQSVAHEDRALVTSFARTTNATAEERTLFVANVHLSGGASPDRRLRQIHGVTERIRKWAAAAAAKPKPKGRRGSATRQAQEASAAREAVLAASPPPPPCLLIAGDFNSDGNTGVRRLLVQGCVEPDWKEPQYRDVELTCVVVSDLELATRAPALLLRHGREHQRCCCGPDAHISAVAEAP